jgi:hypothetical protein
VTVDIKCIIFAQRLLFIFVSLNFIMSDSVTRKSLFSRPLDLIYLIYFATHIPVTLGIDCQVFYPPEWVPQVLKDALLMYTRDYKDPFMGSKEPMYWFLSFIVCEVIVQLPFFFIACIGLVKGEAFSKYDTFSFINIVFFF